MGSDEVISAHRSLERIPHHPLGSVPASYVRNRSIAPRNRTLRPPPITTGYIWVFHHPKQADFTESGREYLKYSEQEDINEYEYLSHSELIEKVHRLEEEIVELESSFPVFRWQVVMRLD